MTTSRSNGSFKPNVFPFGKFLFFKRRVYSQLTLFPTSKPDEIDVSLVIFDRSEAVKRKASLLKLDCSYYVMFLLYF